MLRSLKRSVPQNDRPRTHLRLEALEDRTVPSTVIYSNTFSWNGVASVAVTVTQDAPGYAGKYLWNYHLTNQSYTSGITTFALPAEDSSMVSQLGSSVSWVGSVGSFMSDPDLVAWVGPQGPPGPVGDGGEGGPPGSPAGLAVGQSADFWFTTATTAAGVALTSGVISNGILPSLSVMPAGFVATPVPRGAGLPVASVPAILVADAMDWDTAWMGLTTLREAIKYVNDLNQPNQQWQVRFTDGMAGRDNLPGATILLRDLGTLPQITSNIFINGTFTNGTSKNITVERDPMNSGFRIFMGSNASKIQIAGLTLQGGDGGTAGGAIRTAGDLTLQLCVIQNNEAISGAGVYCSGGSLTIQSCTIRNNEGESGGGVYAKTDTVTIQNSVIFHNTAAGGEGGGIYIGDRVAQATLIGSDITGNTADSMGGGVYIAGSGSFTVDTTVSNCFIHNNTAGKGAGIAVAVGGAPVLRLQSNTVISYNTAGTKGGGVYLGAGTLTYSYTIITHNFATVGGGLYLVDGTTWPGPYADPTHSDISQNLADDWNQGAA